MSEVRRAKIGDLCTIEKGNTGLAKAVPGSYPLVTTGAERKSSNTYQFDAKAVCIPLVSSTGHGKRSLNYVHYQEGTFALGSILAAIIPKDEKVLNARYLHVYLQKNKDRVIVPLMKGAANVSLSVKAISNIEISLPSFQDQEKALAKLDGISGEFEDFQKESDLQINLFRKLRQAVLQEAIEGKLTAEWRKRNLALISGENHASKLLEKIKAEKERLIKEGKIRKDKPLSPITDEEKPFNLPEGWVWCRLPQILESDNSLRRGPFGSSITKLMFVPKSESAMKVYEQKNAIYKNYSLGHYFISLIEHPNLKGFLAKPGDILISCAGTIGETYLLPPDAPLGIINQALLKLRLHQMVIDNEFFRIVFNVLTKSKINEDAKGTAMKNISSVNYLKNKLLFPLPPFAEQQAIVEQVEKMMAMINELEKQVTERKKQSAMLMQSVLREAFTQNI